MSRLDDIATRIRERIPDSVTDGYTEFGTAVLVTGPEHLVDVLSLLRDGSGFDLLSDVSAVDWLPREPRFDVNYHLYSMTHNDRLRVKVRLPDADRPTLPTAAGVWPAADWHEREIFDFFGIVFEGHPDLRRILMPDEWVGHPLRKDYDVGGVPVEYKIEPAYVGQNVVSPEARASAGGVPARLDRDRGKPSDWTWTGPPATGVRIPRRRRPAQGDDTSAEDAQPQAPEERGGDGS